MTDIFTEVDEDLRRERARQFWERWGKVLVAVCVAIVVGVAGWRGYTYWLGEKEKAAGDSVFAASRDVTAGNADTARATLDKLAAEGPGGYPILARFKIADMELKAGKADEALKLFDAIAADATLAPDVRDMARLRAAYVSVDLDDRAATDSRAAVLDTPTGAFRFGAREVRALAALKVDEFATAKTFVDAIVKDAAAPREVAQRAEILSAVIRGRLGQADAATGPDKKVP